MIEFTPFRQSHIKYIAVNTVQTEELALLMSPEAADALSTGPALSVWQSGVCLGAAGLVVHWPGRAEAWALFGRTVGVSVMRACVRTMKKVLHDQPHRRVDMTVREGNIHGHVLAKATGFELECKLEAYHTTGDDMYMYKRIKK